MPGFLVNVGATVFCPHQVGKVTIAPSQVRVTASGEPVATVNAIGAVAGCPFMVGPKPQPCVTAQWMVAALRVQIGGQAALLKDSIGLCKSAEQAPQGPPNVLVTQVRVKGM